MPEVTSHLSFDAGIELISMQSGLALASLPDSAPMVPTVSHYTQQLTKLLFPPSIEQTLLESLAPDIENRLILNPVTYHATLEQCQGQLQALADEHAGTPQGEKLQRAADELQAESEMCQLLTMSRHLLHQA